MNKYDETETPIGLGPVCREQFVRVVKERDDALEEIEQLKAQIADIHAIHDGD